MQALYTARRALPFTNAKACSSASKPSQRPPPACHAASTLHYDRSQAKLHKQTRTRQVQAKAVALALDPNTSYTVQQSADWLVNIYQVWFGLFGLTALAFGVRSFSSKSSSERAGNYLSAMINFVASMAYFAMANGQGRVWVIENSMASEVLWARYADWTITTPLLLVHLAMFGGLRWDQWLTLILSDVIMILTGLQGDLLADSSKWAWFAFACLGQLIIAVQLFGPAKENAFAKSQEGGEAYTKALYYLIIVWLFYPVVWGLDHGTETISASTAGASYAVLDLLAKPLFSALLFYLPLHDESD